MLRIFAEMAVEAPIAENAPDNVLDETATFFTGYRDVDLDNGFVTPEAVPNPPTQVRQSLFEFAS